MKHTHKSHEVDVSIPEYIYFVDGFCHEDGRQHKGYKTFVNIVSTMIHNDKNKTKKQTKILGPRAVMYTDTRGNIYQIILEEEKWILISFMVDGMEYCHLVSDLEISRICTVIGNKSINSNEACCAFFEGYLIRLPNTVKLEQLNNCSKATDDEIDSIIKFNERCH